MLTPMNKLVAQIYDAAIEPEQWPDVLRQLSDLTGHSSIYLCHTPLTEPSAGYNWLHEFDPSAVKAYKRDHATPDYAGVAACIVNPVGSLIDRRKIADDRTFLADPGHQALFVQQGLFHGIISPVFRDEISLSALLCFRNEKRGPLDERSVETLRHLMPHLKRAIGIHQRMARLSNDVAMLSGALQRLLVGVVSVGAGMSVTFANQEGERILSMCDGINQIGKKLVLARKSEHDRLSAAIGRQADGVGGSDSYIYVERPSGAPDFTLLVAPYRGSPAMPGLVERSNSVATIFITDPANPSHLPSAEQLADRFGLTATESEVARLTAMGRGMPYVSLALSVSLNTARTHLKSIYSKMGVNQQSHLTRCIVESFPPVVAET